MVTNFSTCNLSFVHFVHIFQNVHLIPKEKFRKVSIGQILTKTLNLLANLQHLPKASVRGKQTNKNSDQLVCNMQPLVVLKKLVNY